MKAALINPASGQQAKSLGLQGNAETSAAGCGNTIPGPLCSGSPEAALTQTNLNTEKCFGHSEAVFAIKCVV